MAKDTARAIYDILVAEAGANEADREDFVVFYGETLRNRSGGYRFGGGEYRFGGQLGFGGKIWYQDDTGWYVSCYREDETPGRLKVIERTNAALAKFNTPDQLIHWSG